MTTGLMLCCEKNVLGGLPWRSSGWLHPSTEGDMGSTPGQEVKILNAQAWPKKKKKVFVFLNFQKGTESEDKFKRQMSRVTQIQSWDSVSITGSRQRKRAYKRWIHFWEFPNESLDKDGSRSGKVMIFYPRFMPLMLFWGCWQWAQGSG